METKKKATFPGSTTLARSFWRLPFGSGIARPRSLSLALVLTTATWLSTAATTAQQINRLEEIRRFRGFAEPFVSASAPTDADNISFHAALRAFAARNHPDDYSSLENFAAKQRNSSWLGSLAYNLGQEQYNRGYYSKALTNWAKAWQLLKSNSEPECKTLADRAGGELALMLARLGRMDELKQLLQEFEGRPIVGSATERISGARQGLWTMQHRPEIAFRCGPLALDRIRAAKHSTLAGHALVQNSTSTTNGFSLDQLTELASALGMNYRAAFRSPGAPFIMNSVVNWKVGHYAALLNQSPQGHYHLQDPTFGSDAWVTGTALEAETSGYFLVPAGPLPKGWRAVGVEEARKIFGKGTTANSDPDSTSDDDKKKDCFAGLFGMAMANAHLMVVSLNIEDNPVGYHPPVGPPVMFRAVYNHRENGQPAIFTYSNLGPKWTFNWLAYVKDNPTDSSADVSLYVDGGGSQPFQNFDPVSQTFQVQLKSQALLKRTSTNSYELLYRDGSKKIFSLAGPGITVRRVYMTQVIDPAGNTVSINYDGSYRITSLVDAIGQTTTFAYTHPVDPLKITKVTDPFGRFASFQYEPGGLMRLTNIVDVIGLTSSFQYSNSTDFIQALTTPYGTSRFSVGESGRTRWLELSDPYGDTERVEFTESNSVGIPNSWPPSMLPAGMFVRNWVDYARNTFVWDKKAFKEGRDDYTKARLYHWLHTANYVDAFSGIEFEKAPLENPVWYNYPGQTDLYGAIDDSATRPGTSDQPSKVGRVLDDGTTQLWQYDYNIVGRLTTSVDPVGRRMSLVYATNNIDLLEIRQTTGTNNDLLAKFAYNNQHLPVVIWDAAGQARSNSYNSRGQLTSTTAANGATRTFSYDTNGYLVAIDGPLPGTNDTTVYAYDAFGRVRTTSEPDGLTMTYSYDAMNRLTNVTFPDGTFAAFTYSRLDRVKLRDRLGRETTYSYDNLRRMISRQDPLGRLTRYEYCGCGALSALIDPMGRKTRWEYDVQGRLTAKEYADGARVLRTYESTTSRLKSIRDEKGQFTFYDYYDDDSRRRISYPNAQIATPSVSFTYDPNYARLLTMQDGIGTTLFSYHPAGSLGALQTATVDGPWTNDVVTYAYDELRRVTNRAINGVAQGYGFDAMGRATNIINALGSFAYAYDGVSARVRDLTYPFGQSTHYDYFDDLGDRRLQRITHSRPNSSLLSRFTYARDAVGNVTNWLQESDALTETWALTYDKANQLLSLSGNQFGTNLISSAYAYDPAGNRLSDDTNGVGREFHYNALNQLISASDAAATNVTYEWDGQERLVAIVKGTNRSEFSYNGMGRLMRVVEKSGLLTLAERRFVWCGYELCEERNAADSVVNRYFFQGEQDSGTSFYYAKDHLGSIRTLADSTGSIRGQYTYGAFGNATKLQGDLEANFGFTGHLRHQTSGLVLTPYRAYDPTLGRWLSRDPLGEVAGANLYAYTSQNPINRTDPLGLFFAIDDIILGGIGAIAGLAGQAATDVATGQNSGLWAYIAAENAGGVAGLFSEYEAAGAIAGMLGNLFNQAWGNLTGTKCGFDPFSLVWDTTLGWVTDFLPAPAKPGLKMALVGTVENLGANAMAPVGQAADASFWAQFGP